MATTILTGQVTVTTAATLICASVGTRVRVRIRPLDAGILFVGPAGVTPATGYNPCGNNPQQQEEAQFDQLTGDLFGVVSQGTMKVAFAEVV